MIFGAWTCLGALEKPMGQIGHILAAGNFLVFKQNNPKQRYDVEQMELFFVFFLMEWLQCYNSHKGLCIQKPGDFVFYRCCAFLKLPDHLMIDMIDVDLLAVRSNQGSEHSK